MFILFFSFSFFFNDTATTEIYTLSLHDALPSCATGSSSRSGRRASAPRSRDRPRVPLGAVRRRPASPAPPGRPSSPKPRTRPVPRRPPAPRRAAAAAPPRAGRGPPLRPAAVSGGSETPQIPRTARPPGASSRRCYTRRRFLPRHRAVHSRAAPAGEADSDQRKGGLGNHGGVRDFADARSRPGGTAPGGDRRAHAGADRARRRYVGAAGPVGP